MSQIHLPGEGSRHAQLPSLSMHDDQTRVSNHLVLTLVNPIGGGHRQMLSDSVPVAVSASTPLGHEGGGRQHSQAMDLPYLEIALKD